MMAQKEITVVDWIIIGTYFAICLSIGVYTKLKQKKNTAEEYFLAGRSMVWFVVGSSMYASNIGAEHFIGLAGSGASTGVAVVSYEWHSSWVILLLGFFFVPIYIRSEIYTMPEYLKCRFQSKWMRIYLTVVCLINYMITKIAVDIYAGSLFLKEAVNCNMYLSSFILLSFTAIYTLLGGLSAVIYTDFLQCMIMVVGGTILALIGFNKVGGFSGLWKMYPHAVGKSIQYSNSSFLFSKHTDNETLYNSTMACYSAEDRWGHIFRPLNDDEFPWIGVVFTIPIIAIWYWCTDQVIVQRALGAKSLAHARGGAVLAGFLKILPFFIMITPGMIARVLFPDIIACPDYDSCMAQCGNGMGCSNHAYPQMVLNILPQGLVGLMLSVMIASVMSSLSSAFNSSSTIFTIDIWKTFRPKAQDKELLWVGRVVIIILVGIGIAWIPIVQSGGKGQLFTYLQSIQSYLSPPITAVFFVGMLWPNLTEAGALSSMLIGLLLGIIRFLFDVIYAPPTCGNIDNRPSFAKLHFMYYALIQFFVCIILMCSISVFTRPVPLQMLGRLTWKTINNPKYIYDDNSEGNGINMDNEPLAHPEKDVANNGEEQDVKIKSFEEQSKVQKWAVWSGAVVLMVVMLSMFIWMA